MRRGNGRGTRHETTPNVIKSFSPVQLEIEDTIVKTFSVGSLCSLMREK